MYGSSKVSFSALVMVSFAGSYKTACLPGDVSRSQVGRVPGVAVGVNSDTVAAAPYSLDSAVEVGFGGSLGQENARHMVQRANRMPAKNESRFGIFKVLLTV